MRMKYQASRLLQNVWEKKTKGKVVINFAELKTTIDEEGYLSQN